SVSASRTGPGRSRRPRASKPSSGRFGTPSRHPRQSTRRIRESFTSGLVVLGVGFPFSPPQLEAADPCLATSPLPRRRGQELSRRSVMPAKAPSRGDEPRFVFKGTVRKLRASTEPEVKASARTAVVRVDEVIHAPEALADVAGHDVTVELGGREK